MTFHTGLLRSFLNQFQFILVGLLVCLCIGFFSSAQAQEKSTLPNSPTNTTNPSAEVTNLLSTYRVAAGDVITIRVYGEDDLTREKVRISDAGTFAFPFLGEVKALGLTSGEIERAIFNGLNGRFLVNPRVAVSIEVYRPFFINGMIATPGAYPYQPGLTVLKASSLAGGFKERASLSKIFIVRENDPKGTPQKVDLNSPVNPGDTIFIEESFF
ncbi:polysaccharide biosynthesis/export family protein [Rhodoferax sp.]|uniref:polysaccharide biosynthesis/export family protein n=1 Tax=Rhodoferax sp. TaxID=50421 RepID=UPI0026149D76|nr:polysaccharide biosynthesis/export family protein [Rhodoferax sp.]MDD2808195.1 polysaccharide export protein [Rhodoferax sp.]MDD4942012.1 polysaccharide export protein [Rhodoferax sp.]MDD5480380.1 polysaccharide export protein [Rhodoferax sp.]